MRPIVIDGGDAVSAKSGVPLSITIESKLVFHPFELASVTRAHAPVQRGITEPPSDVARGRGLLDAVDLRPGGDEHVDDARHTEHGGMEECRAARHARASSPVPSTSRHSPRKVS